MKNRGFTLVELLAVIVILAIIALIAVPIFLGMINNSKKSSDKESVNLYTDTVEKAIQKKQMADPNFQPDKCEIQSDGNLECFSGTTSLGTVKVTMKGTKPTAGTILIDEEDITYENIVLNGKIYYEKEVPSIEIGDKITYKDTDWYVIEKPTSSQDYVTLIKETVLTSAELGTYAYTKPSYMGGGLADTAIFHNNSNEYATSNIKAALESYATTNNMMTDLKEVQMEGTNYKIRLITTDELINNLGWTSGLGTSATAEGNDVPTWVYSGYGDNLSYVQGYWTMTQDDNDVNNVSSNGSISHMSVTSGNQGVRPVINLLKSAIPAQS